MFASSNYLIKEFPDESLPVFTYFDIAVLM